MQMTLGQLIIQMRLAQARMSKKNAHRVLFGQCEQVILQLVDQLAHEAALTQSVVGAVEHSAVKGANAEEAPQAV